MKGFIFTEFFEMVSTVFSPDMLEKIIDASKLPNDGAYTDIGTYDYRELITLITHLSKLTQKSISKLEVAYGQYLFTKLLQRYRPLVIEAKSTFNFLTSVDEHVHVEVLKLYPEAELPRFMCTIVNPKKMIMEYRSNHPFADLAEGLILGCADHYQEKIIIERTKLPPKEGKSVVVLFTLLKE